MDIRVRLFAAVADAVGASSVLLGLGEPATVGALRAAAHARGIPLAHCSMIAVNETYARDDQVIAPDDEVALVHPVAGG